MDHGRESCRVWRAPFSVAPVRACQRVLSASPVLDATGFGNLGTSAELARIHGRI